jgi:Uncharacterised nucleotidyltransferase
MQTLLRSNSQILGTNLCSELELIFCCATTQLSAEKIERIKILIKQELDWDYLIQIAYGHGLILLLYTNLNTIAKEIIPETAFNQIRSLFYANAQRNMLLTGELVKILRLLQEHGISAVPYKGPVLAKSLYGNISLRQFADLDIIVRNTDDVLKVKSVLVAHGYKAKQELTNIEEIAYFQSKSEHTYDFIDESKSILLEVHWRITPKYKSPIEPKHFWKKLEKIEFAGIIIPYLPLEDWLLILCVHGSRHRWEKLSWPCDIAQLIRITPEINWQQLIKQAIEFDCKRMLFLGLFLAHHLMEARIPEEVLLQIEADSAVPNLASEICQELLSKDSGSQKILANTFYHLKIREQWQNKVLYLESFVRWLINPNKELDGH